MRNDAWRAVQQIAVGSLLAGEARPSGCQSTAQTGPYPYSPIEPLNVAKGVHGNQNVADRGINQIDRVPVRDRKEGERREN